MSKPGVLAALLLHLCVVGLLAATPALTSRAAVDASNDAGLAGRWPGARALLQVRLLACLTCLRLENKKKPNGGARSR